MKTRTMLLTLVAVIVLAVSSRPNKPRSGDSGSTTSPRSSASATRSSRPTAPGSRTWSPRPTSRRTATSPRSIGWRLPAAAARSWSTAPSTWACRSRAGLRTGDRSRFWRPSRRRAMPLRARSHRAESGPAGEADSRQRRPVSGENRVVARQPDDRVCDRGCAREEAGLPAVERLVRGRAELPPVHDGADSADARLDRAQQAGHRDVSHRACGRCRLRGPPARRHR